MASVPATPTSERAPEKAPVSNSPRVLSEEERKKLVDAAVDSSIAENAELLRRLAK